MGEKTSPELSLIFGVLFLLILVDFRDRFGTKNAPKIEKKRDRFFSGDQQSTKNKKNRGRVFRLILGHFRSILGPSF